MPIYVLKLAKINVLVDISKQSLISLKFLLGHTLQ